MSRTIGTSAPQAPADREGDVLLAPAPHPDTPVGGGWSWGGRPVPSLVVGAVACLVAALPWMLPRLGALMAVAFLLLLVPVGRRLGERALLVMLLLLTATALAFQAGRMLHVALGPDVVRPWLSVSVLVVGLAAVVRPWRPLLPAAAWSDLVVGLVGVGVAALLLIPYRGRGPGEILSGLYLNGWDNQHHLAMFVLTAESGGIDWGGAGASGSLFAGYPSLHEQLWAVATWLSYPDASVVSRLDMLHLYVLWSALTFAACVMALAWTAADLAGRLVRDPAAKGTARVVAAGTVGVAAGLSGLTYLYNFGFTNYVLALVLVVVTAYLSVRDRESVLSYGWLAVLAGTVCVSQLWAPLILGLLPAWFAVVVVLARASRVRLLVLVGVTAVGLVAARSMIVTAVQGLSLSSLAGMTGGMAPFNVTAAVLLPVVLLLLWPLVSRRGGALLAVAVVPVAPLLLLLAGLMARAADNLGVPRFSSYYTLKILDGALIAAAVPLVAIAAAAAAAVLRRESGRGPVRRWYPAVAVGAIGLAVVSAFGYVGVTAATLPAGFPVAPGVSAFATRWNGVTKITEGQLTLAAAAKAGDSERLPIMWDGGDLLHNRWLRSLTWWLTAADDSVYSALPGPPYGQTAVDALRAVLRANPDLRVRILWLRDETRALLAPLVQEFGSRVELVRYG